MKKDRDETTAEKVAGHWIWRAQGTRTRIALVGRGPETGFPGILALLEDSPRRAARLRQVHSSAAIEAFEGLCGEADALYTAEADLALGVATADCLPIVLSGQGQSAAVHAGWRGLESGILHRTLECLTDPGEELTAWIGPGIGPCCYEVGRDVATRVANASSSEVIVEQSSGALHLDLVQAARVQLSAAGVQNVASLPVCTYCDAERLWSYRRQGPRAGRNWTLAWRTSPSAS